MGIFAYPRRVAQEACASLAPCRVRRLTSPCPPPLRTARTPLNVSSSSLPQPERLSAINPLSQVLNLNNPNAPMSCWTLSFTLVQRPHIGLSWKAHGNDSCENVIFNSKSIISIQALVLLAEESDQTEACNFQNG